LSAQEFIEAFAQYLKKNNLIERPAWVDLVKTSTSISFLMQEMSLLLKMKIGSITVLLPSQERSTSDLAQVSVSFPIFTEDSREENADLNSTSTPQPRSSDGAFNNWRSRNSSRKTRKEMSLRLTPVSFQVREEELSTVSPLNTSRTRNDHCNHTEYSPLLSSFKTGIYWTKCYYPRIYQ
jgi:hypothetical protein